MKAQKGSGNLLTHVVTTVGRRQAENLTTAALVYIVQQYEPARRTFIQLLRDATGINLPQELWFEFQASQGGARVPDVAAIDADNKERVLIEVKLTAGFGPDQAHDYFERLSSVEPAALCILAPSRRIPFLWLDARRQIEGLEEDPSLTSVRRAVLGKKVLTALAWNDLMKALEEALAGLPDGQVEIAQLRGVSEFYDRRDFLPFAGDDLSVSTGLLLQQLADVVDEVASICVTQGVLKDTKPSSGYDHGLYYGYWGTVASWPVWFGLWTVAWLQVTETPLWLQFYDRDLVAGGHAHRVLRSLDRADLSRVFSREAKKDVVVALAVPTGVSEERTVLQIVDQIREVGERIEVGEIS